MRTGGFALAPPTPSIVVSGAGGSVSLSCRLPPNMNLPADNSAFNYNPNSRNFTFSWATVEGVNAGYQLFVCKNVPPYEDCYKWYLPPGNTNPSYRVSHQVNTGTNQTINIPNSFGNNLRWGVAACVNIGADIGRRCGRSDLHRAFTISGQPSVQDNPAVDQNIYVPKSKKYGNQPPQRNYPLYDPKTQKAVPKKR